jgi:hypothetical protein
MIGWLLAQLEQSPGRAFTAAELTAVRPTGLDELRQASVLKRERRLAGPLGRVSSGRLLTVVEEAGHFAAFDPDEPDHLPERIDVSQVEVWRPDRERILELLADKYGLTGRPELLQPRLGYAGRTSAGASVCLGLFQSPTVAGQVLPTLPILLGPHHSAHVVVLPTLQPALSLISGLAQQRIGFAHIVSDELDTAPDVHAVASDLLQAGQLNAGEARRPFRHSESFRWIECDGTEFILSMNQALVVKQLHEFREPVHESQVLEELVDEIKSTRIAEVFKGSKIIGTFVIPLPKAHYRLKYYDE